MNYTSFKKKCNPMQLARVLGLVIDKSTIVQIDTHPLYDLSPYEGSNISTYIFRNEWSYPIEFLSIHSPKIIRKGLFHSDDIARIASELGLSMTGDYDMEALLKSAHDRNDNIMEEEANEPEIDQFRILDLQIERSDNLFRSLIFMGSYKGDSSSIGPMDWGFFAEISFKAIVRSEKNELSLFSQLLAESLSLLDAGNNKLSYLIAFTAFDYFINERLNSHDTAERLKDKVNKLFKSKFEDLNKNQIYTSVISELSKLEQRRNKIAHGTGGDDTTRSDVNELLMFSLSLVCLFETEANSLTDLFSRSEELSGRQQSEPLAVKALPNKSIPHD